MATDLSGAQARVGPGSKGLVTPRDVSRAAHLVMPPGPAEGRHRVVVVGAGFGGLEVVHRLRGAEVSITLIDQRNHHIFQP